MNIEQRRLVEDTATRAAYFRRIVTATEVADIAAGGGAPGAIHY